MTPNEIQHKTFSKAAVGGYKIDEVSAYLFELSEYISALASERDELEKKMLVLAEKVEEYREDEESLRAALIGAQKLGDSVIKDAKKKAEVILAEANAKSKELIADAQSSIDRESISLSKMQSEVATFKNQILSLYKRQIEKIEAISNELTVTPTVQKAIQNVPKSEKKAPEATKGKKDAQDFVLKFDDQPIDSPDEAADARPKRTNFGDLRFGKEYNLTRNE